MCKMYGYVDRNTGCWIWIGTRDSYGYACIRDGKLGMKLGHRLYYKALVNPDLQSTDQLHHVCKNRKCVNPNHLEVTDGSNHHKDYHNLYTRTAKWNKINKELFITAVKEKLTIKQLQEKFNVGEWVILKLKRMHKEEIHGT